MNKKVKSFIRVIGFCSVACGAAMQTGVNDFITIVAFLSAVIISLGASVCGEE